MPTIEEVNNSLKVNKSIEDFLSNTLIPIDVIQSILNVLSSISSAGIKSKEAHTVIRSMLTDGTNVFKHTTTPYNLSYITDFVYEFRYHLLTNGISKEIISNLVLETVSIGYDKEDKLVIDTNNIKKLTNMVETLDHNVNTLFLVRYNLGRFINNLKYVKGEVQDGR